MEHGFRIFWSDGNILDTVCHDKRELDVSMYDVLFVCLLIRKYGYICCKDPKTTNHRQLQKQKEKKTGHFAACTQAVVRLRRTSYIAIELNNLHLKSYEI